MFNAAINKKSQSVLSEQTKSHLYKSLCSKFKFTEYFFYNSRLIELRKLYSEISKDEIYDFLRLKRFSKVKLKEFTLIGQTNSGSYGNNYLVKYKNACYNLKTINSSLISARKDSMDYMTLNYIGLLRERDALLNCGGLWTAKVFRVFNYHNLQIIVITEALTGWNLSYCINLIHYENPSKAFINLKRNQMTLNAQKALLTGSLHFIEPISEKLKPIITFWMAELLTAIRFIHKQGILHRNLTTDNVIVDTNGHLKLNDFNLNSELYEIHNCKETNRFYYKNINKSTELTETILNPDPCDTRRRIFSNRFAYAFKTFGYQAFSAPELHANSTIAEYTSKCDYWSAGCIFFQMIFTINPFDVCTTNLEQAKLNISKKTLLNPDIIAKRCESVPSATALLDILCVEYPDYRLDDDFNAAVWKPNALDFFSGIELDSNLLSFKPPFKPVIENELLYVLNNNFMNIESNDIIYDIFNNAQLDTIPNEKYQFNPHELSCTNSETDPVHSNFTNNISLKLQT